MRDTEKNIFTKTPVVIALAVIATMLWGSAFPMIKIGYRLFTITAENTAAKLMFAGSRFFLAGLLTIAAASFLCHKPAAPKVKNLGVIAILGLFQTAIQYFFFYIALSHTSGVKGSIIDSSCTFFGVIFAHFAYRNDKLTFRKTTGCLIGFAGIILINLNGSGSLGGGFSLTGEGFMLLAAMSFGFSSIISKYATQETDPVTATGYQLLIGGAVLAAMGFAGGARFTVPDPAAFSVFLYLAFISSVAFTLWTILLKHNPVSKISIFNFLTPVFGVILSGLFLGESFLSLKTLFSLLLVCFGIYVVERSSEKTDSPAVV